MKKKMLRFTGVAVLSSLSGSAIAHTGTHTEGLLNGLAHPFSGIDHLLAMLLVGLWAATLDSGRKALLVPLAFIACMGAGASVGVAAYGVPMTELGIAFSVLFLGLMLMSRAQLSLGIAAPLVGAFALFHGNAHGLEMQTAHLASYFSGFIAATAALHLAGMALGRKLMAHPWAMRSLGLVSGIVGTSLMLSA